MSAKHTPTPWEICRLPDGELAITNDAGETLFYMDEGAEDRANAEFIVLAVNSHEAILEAALELGGIAAETNHMTPDRWAMWEKIQAIAKAEAVIP